MALYRNVLCCVVVIVITMLTLNIDLRKQSDLDQTPLQRKKRAIGYKPANVFGVCGGSSYGRNGWIASPNFPASAYPSRTKCNWTITVYPRMVIRFHFVFMDMEGEPMQKRGSCNADYLRIMEGPKEDDELVGGQKYCGNDTTFTSVFSKTNKVYIYFGSDRDTEGQGFAVRWEAVPPPKAEFDCDFELVKGLCTGWEQNTTDEFDWTTHNGKTRSGMSAATGPVTDHTRKNAIGVYLYTEASGVKAGEKAGLMSPFIRITNKKGQCLRFWYHMRGEAMGVLNVYKRELVSENNSTDTLIFTKSGDQGRLWRKADLNVSASDYRTQFVFESIRGTSYTSDLAIDDIEMLKRPCPKPWVYVPTTKAPTTQPATTRRGRKRPVAIATTRRPRTLPTTLMTTTSPDCYYKCKEVGNCIEKSYFCDGVYDCLRREDEDGCVDTTAGSTTVRSATNDWSTWSSWSSCTATCGGGRSERERRCQGGGPFSCVGSSSEGVECNTHKCLKWNDWQDWSPCTFSCNGGIKTRARTCDGGNYGQRGCLGPYIQVDECNKQNCPVWSDWTQWSQCAATCGNGTVSRSRSCQGGQAGDIGCLGNATEYLPCQDPTNPTCGEWTQWSDFSECTRTCGVGRRTRSRKCLNSGEISQGCSGSSVIEENCNTISCPEWTEWRPQAACSVTCGSGMRSKARKCLQGGVEVQTCEGDAMKEEVCRFEPCRDWADWGQWSPCTKSCGTGFHGRRRLCMMGETRSTGCVGTSIDAGLCNTDPCPSWREWGHWQSCSRTCGGGTHERRRTCDGGAPNTGDCVGDSIEKQTCNDQSCDITTTTKPPVTRSRGTIWGKWSDWNPCSKNCGLGTQQRRRTCIGGKPGTPGCRGRIREEQDCSRGPCTTATTATAGKLKGWGVWTDWGACSVSCGKGTKTRTRECHGGKPGRRGCRGKKKDSSPCQSTCPALKPSTTDSECFERNVAEAKKVGRSCPRKCSTDKACGDDKKCVCDGWCGKTCQKTTKRCKDIKPKKKSNEILSCSNGRTVGSVCTFSCKKGLELQGDAVVICQGISKWTNEKELPTCAEANDPPKPPKSCRMRNKKHDACCGAKSFNSNSAKCCNGVVSPAGKSATKCCAAKPYNPRQKGCCKTKLFSTSRQKCVKGRIVKK